MRKKLVKTGNSLALVLDREFLRAAGVGPDTPLEVSTDGEIIVISPVRRKARTARLRSIVREAHGDYGGVFKRLADA
jgi:antitoxin component of MazEF toxin-antitoxin module